MIILSFIAKYKIKNSDSLKLKIYENYRVQLTYRYDSLIKEIEHNYPNYYQLKYSNKVLSVIKVQQKLKFALRTPS